MTVVLSKQEIMEAPGSLKELAWAKNLWFHSLPPPPPPPIASVQQQQVRICRDFSAELNKVQRTSAIIQAKCDFSSSFLMYGAYCFKVVMCWAEKSTDCAHLRAVCVVDVWLIQRKAFQKKKQQDSEEGALDEHLKKDDMASLTQLFLLFSSSFLDPMNSAGVMLKPECRQRCVIQWWTMRPKPKWWVKMISKVVHFVRSWTGSTEDPTKTNGFVGCTTLVTLIWHWHVDQTWVLLLFERSHSYFMWTRWTLIRLG